MLRETARRICKAKEIILADADVLWQFTLPQLANAVDLCELTRGLRAAGVQVVVIDPLYLCLLAGADSGSASNVFTMGPLLLGIARACLDAGVTPLLVHHTGKPAGAKGIQGGMLELVDLAMAGVAEFARQWLLLWRREAYEPGTGRHGLMLSAGGCAGQSGAWGLDINEGILGDDFTGRKWEVSVAPFGDMLVLKADEKAEKKRQTEERRDHDDDARLLGAVDELCAKSGQGKSDGPEEEKKNAAVPVPAPVVVGYTQARTLAKLNTDRMTRSVQRLAGVIEEAPYSSTSGHAGATVREGRGLRRIVKKAIDRIDGIDGTNRLFSAESRHVTIDGTESSSL